MMRVVAATTARHNKNAVLTMRPINGSIGGQRTMLVRVGVVAASGGRSGGGSASSSSRRCYWMTTSNHTTATSLSTEKRRNHHHHHQSPPPPPRGDNNSYKAATNLFMAVAAMISLRPIMTMAEGRVKQKKVDPKNLKFPHNGKPCPNYGCPLFPLDIVEQLPSDPKHNARHLAAPKIFQSLNDIRNSTRQELFSAEQKSQSAVNLTQLSSTANEDQGTMMMTGFKGGPAGSQINQDRAIVVGPYFIKQSDSEDNQLLGVFDGHATRGELVSEFVVTELPKLLKQRLEEALSATKVGPSPTEEDIVKKVLGEVFVELDKKSPADPTGGCTATVVLKFNDTIYVANAGDSVSMIGIYQKSTKTCAILYTSREDKPHLPDERRRVEEAGGYVYVPPRGTSRVVYVNPLTGGQTGLAMSRSIGDWSFGKLGVIPDPIVDTIHIPTLIQNLTHSNTTTTDNNATTTTEEKTNEDDQPNVEPPPVQVDDFYVFGISGTDGLMDYVAKDGIAQVVAQALFEEEGTHPATAAELLVNAAAQGWDKFRQGRYRDDIAIAFASLREPPAATTEKDGDDDTTKAKKDEL